MESVSLMDFWMKIVSSAPCHHPILLRFSLVLQSLRTMLSSSFQGGNGAIYGFVWSTTTKRAIGPHDNKTQFKCYFWTISFIYLEKWGLEITLELCFHVNKLVCRINPSFEGGQGNIKMLQPLFWRQPQRADAGDRTPRPHLNSVCDVPARLPLCDFVTWVAGDFRFLQNDVILQGVPAVLARAFAQVLVLGGWEMREYPVLHGVWLVVVVLKEKQSKEL